MVEYAVLLAHNSVNFMSGVSNDVVAWASRLNWTLFAYAAAALILLRLLASVIRPTRRY